jgi:glycosyltransferase involved in cell wall biosynthesis
LFLAPHFAEYTWRLAAALAAEADVLVIFEARNREAECQGLTLPSAFETPTGSLRQMTYKAAVALQRFAPHGLFARQVLWRAIKRFAPDILHIQEQGDWLTAALATRLAQTCPIVLTVHDPTPHSGHDAAVARMFAAGLRRLREVASAFHVHGPTCAAHLRDRVGSERQILSTAHGVILCDGSAALGSSVGSFLFFGRMEAYKGIDTLLAAIDRLRDKTHLRFVFAGRGPELDRLRAEVAAKPSIELMDRFLSPREAIDQFQRACAVLVPYRDATQSGVVSAAVGNGRPVIATRVGGLVDAVEDGVSGLLIPPDDPQALAAAIEALADPATAERLAAGARAAARSRFAWSTIGADLLDLYRDLSRAPGRFPSKDEAGRR